MPTAQGVLLAIHSKRTEPLDIKSPLVAYVRSTYSDREADEAADDLETIQQLRAEVASGAQTASRETLSRYVRCLTAIETRFPISKERGHAQLAFPWYDAFRPAKKVAQFNIHYEKAAVLFNLGAMLSQQALACDRTTPEGLTQACKVFQEAAGVFQCLRENESNKTDAPRPVDTSAECASMLEKLMLAQAQECVYNKASLDKKSLATLARLARQTCSMYSEVERLFAGPALAAHFDKGWVAHVQLKGSVYDVEALVQGARALHADDKVNLEIAVLQEAFKRLQNTKKIAKGISIEMLNSVNAMQETVQHQLTKAEKDNASIYLMRVPPFSEVPPVTGALLVKASLPTNLDAAQETLFTGLIPDGSAKALSKYTDMVDSVIRQQLDIFAEATDTARLRLKEWELPDTLQSLDAKTSGSLPEGVRRELDDISGIGGLSHLKGILAEIGELRKSVEAELFQCQAALDGDAKADAEVRLKYGDKWPAQPSATMAKPYWDTIATYRSSLQKAGESDMGVLKRLSENEAAFAKLSVDSAAAQMPRLQAPLVATTPEDPAVVVATLRRNLEQLQASASERAGMEEALKEMKKKDNVLPKLMACSPQAYDALFANELKKYDALKADATTNVQQQAELLAAIDRGNRSFRTIFDITGWRESCEAAAAGLRESAKTYRELLDHLSEGLRFYIGMSEVVIKARQECNDFAYTRQVQRDELRQDLDRRAAHEEAERLTRQMAGSSLMNSAQVSHAAPLPTTSMYPAAPGSNAGPSPLPPAPLQTYGGQPQHQNSYGNNSSPSPYGQSSPTPPPPQSAYGSSGQQPPQPHGYHPAPPPQSQQQQQWVQPPPPPPPGYQPQPHHQQQQPPPPPSYYQQQQPQYPYGAPPPQQGQPQYAQYPPPGMFPYAQQPPAYGQQNYGQQ